MLAYLGAQWTAHLAMRRERGASAVEYGLLVAAVAAAFVFVLVVMGVMLSEVFRHQNSVVETCHGCGP